MVSFNPPKKNAAHTLFIGLPSQSSSAQFQTNPTIAAGDFQVSIDGGAFANLATLPTVEPAGGKSVKVQLSAAEMNGDNIVLLASDAAGDEWGDVQVNLQTASIQFDDLGDVYWAKLDFVRDSIDEYTIVWLKNDQLIEAGITNCQIHVIKRADGTDLVALTGMTEIAATGAFKYDEAVNMVSDDESYRVVVQATIDGATRKFPFIVGRDV